MHVTVVMSVYQPEPGYLAEQLESIAAQDHDDLSVIVWDDLPGGRDLGPFCRQHCPGRQLTYVPCDANRGYVKAFERLVELAAPQGGVLALCDQDDRWLPTRVSRCMEAFERDGALACACDWSIIDEAGEVVVPSWRAAHPTDPTCQWHTGDRFVAESVFSAYAVGMAMMVRADVAASLVPFSEGTGHDKWLMCGANIMGVCAFVDEPLVQYRRHGHNVSGALAGITCKQDWYDRRLEGNATFANDMKRRFPDCAELDRALAFIEARRRRSVVGIWRDRALAPQIARFEIALKFVPAPLFALALRLLHRER